MQKVHKKRKLGAGGAMSGKYRITTRDSITGEVIKRSDWIPNLIMAGTNTGVNLIGQRLAGLTVYDLEIDEAKIGTGTTAPADSDTDLETVAVSGIGRADQTVATSSVTLSFFIPDATLPNGTYTEFGIFASSQIFARSLISPSYTKGSNQDTTIEYIITFDNTC